jgi:hypothetical protein
MYNRYTVEGHHTCLSTCEFVDVKVWKLHLGPALDQPAEDQQRGAHGKAIWGSRREEITDIQDCEEGSHSQSAQSFRS